MFAIREDAIYEPQYTVSQLVSTTAGEGSFQYRRFSRLRKEPDVAIDIRGVDAVVKAV